MKVMFLRAGVVALVLALGVADCFCCADDCWAGCYGRWERSIVSILN